MVQLVEAAMRAEALDEHAPRIRWLWGERDVGGDILDPPAVAQRREVPFGIGERFQQVG
jgi:hypothetical protein